MAERNEVSIHEVKVFLALVKNADKWLTNREIASLVDGVTRRTVRAHTFKLVQTGVLDQAELFPAHRYRLSQHAEKRNKGYFQRLQQAAQIFGLA